MQPPLPAATAQGSFTKTPLPHLLVYALERQLTGTLEFTQGEESVASLVVVTGFPAKVRTSAGVHYLGEILLDLGIITADHLKASIEALQASPRLQGQLLVEMGATDIDGLEAGLRTQVERKVEFLFSLPAETQYTYYDGFDALSKYGGAPTPIDPLPVLWRGVRAAPSWEHVEATLARVGSSGLRLVANTQVDRVGFLPEEAQLVDLMRTRAPRAQDLQGTTLVEAKVAQLLVYFLTITKQVDLVEDASPLARNAMPVPPPPAPPSSQSLGRMQLQARQVQRAPLVVEEQVTPSVDDARASHPNIALSTPPPPVPEGLGADIGSMISASLPPGAMSPSAAPPPIPAPPAMAVVATPGTPITPAAAASQPMAVVATPGTPIAPAAAASQPKPLTAEQSSLKQKIIERAGQITSQNYFEMLGVNQDATPDQIQKAFFGLAKVWHPDRLPPALIDVKDACSKVFSHLTEANAVLSDETRRKEYVTLIKDGGATPDDQAKIQAVLEAAMEFQKAEILLKRNLHDPQAYDLVKRATTLDPEQVEYIALLTWIDAQRSEWLGKEKTLEKISMLDICIKRSPKSERSYFYRGMLYKRIDDASRAIKDFKKAAELNPKNLDAVREVRLHHMRGGSKPPGASPGARTSKAPAPTQGIGGLFGKLFKK